MSGMQKVGTGAKLEDSNIANYGSKEHKDAKLAAAKTEKAWDGCGQKPGIEVWRIEKFKVVKKGSEEHGKFYTGDSYIILNTYKDPESDKKLYNVHFWLGKETSQDEMGTAAYKTVELDDLLGDLPVQYREVQGHESNEFLELFGGSIQILAGGMESGFNKVKPTEYKPRLLHIKGKKKIRVTEVALETKSLNLGDSFVLDRGLKIYVWNGPKAGIFEKQRAEKVRKKIEEDRNGRPKTTFLGFPEEDEDFWKTLGVEDGKCPGKEALGEESKDDEKPPKREDLYMLSDASGSLEKSEVAKNNLKKDMLKSDDVFILDKGHTVFVWIGKGASKQERSKGIEYGQAHVEATGLAKFGTSVQRVCEGRETKAFLKYFS